MPAEAAEAELSGQRTGEEFNLGGAQRQAMIGAGAGDARGRLDDIEPIHLISDCRLDWARFGQLAAARKFSGVANVAGAAAKEIGIEREDHFRFFHAIDGVEVAAEGKLRAFARAVAYGRLPLMPLGFRKERQDGLNLGGERRRCERTGQDAEARAIGGLHFRRDGLRGVQKLGPGAESRRSL